jgi:two-component system chemotaxis response regulator CheB
MANRDIIVIGASMGGIEALTDLVEQLPAELPAALFVVQHTSSHHSPYFFLPEILERSGPLTVKRAEEADPIQHGTIYVAPPNYHLLVKQDYIRLVYGPPENRVRPAIDPLFRSAAVAYGARVIGVVLTGYQDDGTAGLLAIKRCGGIAIVQDPADAAYPDMPKNALAHVEVDYKLPLAEMGTVLAFLVREEAPESPLPPEDLVFEVKLAERLGSHVETEYQLGNPVPLSCPECGGPLWKMAYTSQDRYRCHMGHGFTAQSLLAGQSEAVEKALWVALRTMEERVNILMQLANFDQNTNGEKSISARRYKEQADEVKGHAKTLRDLLSQGI